MSSNYNNNQESVVFVSNLASSVQEGTLLKIIAEKIKLKVGKITLPRDKFTDQPRGFAFIDMLDNQSANTVISYLNGYSLNGKILTCNLRVDKFKEKSQSSFRSNEIIPKDSMESPEKTVHISNLDFTITKQNIEEMCEDLLREEHPVQNIKFPIDRERGTSKGFCFITFENAESVEAAIEAFDRLPVLGRELKTIRYQPKEIRDIN